ncbi:chemotaxis protein [Bacillaceae bacterium SIJ1]|uniref:globin-coupled sensor protein n=1 Tax=Litoribacterium kuwaitense TaxID=1398745 RepID=UPI0013ED0793|nr:globin-coupled sensor protein [Litoribacterium kuwaitense]NGP46025.1 chemotaxis protein [Litoribacterium kuwaitense]
MINLPLERKKVTNYIGLTDHDLKVLKNARPHFEAIVDQLVDELYADIQRQPELFEIIQQYSTIDRLKQTQKWYFLSLTDGVLDEAYVDKRLHVGTVHSKIGLTADWYLGTYIIYTNLATAHLQRVMPEGWDEAVRALAKMFNFDSQLVLEAYERDEKREIEGLLDNQREMIEGIGSAVQNLASVMKELGSSSEKVASTAQDSAEMQQNTHDHIQDLAKEIDSIDALGTSMKHVADQSQMLGLNAAIEAARAGDAGRGFGVVAEEIRKLARLSEESLNTIEKRIQHIRTVLDSVTQGADQSFDLSRQQEGHAQTMVSFVKTIETLTKELEELRKKN